jgi:hypothetical protein
VIPKKIHYFWFGRGEKPKLAEKCIASWKKYCADYEIIEWNEENFDVNLNGYTTWCYENKKYAFLTDYLRLLIVYEQGGIYFDTDVELLRSPDFLLGHQAFFGFEVDGAVATGLGFGSEAKGAALGAMLAEYQPLLDGRHGVIGCPILNTNALEKLGLRRDGSLQSFSWGTVLPKDYLNPYESATGKLKKTKNTVSVHWYMGSWLPAKQKIRSFISRPLHRIFGSDFMEKFRK